MSSIFDGRDGAMVMVGDGDGMGGYNGMFDTRKWWKKVEVGGGDWWMTAMVTERRS